MEVLRILGPLCTPGLHPHPGKKFVLVLQNLKLVNPFLIHKPISCCAPGQATVTSKVVIGVWKGTWPAGTKAWFWKYRAEPAGSVEGEMEALPLKCSWCKQGETGEHLGACPSTVDQEAAGNRVYCRNTPPLRSLGLRPQGCNLVAPQPKKKDTSAGLL